MSQRSSPGSGQRPASKAGAAGKGGGRSARSGRSNAVQVKPPPPATSRGRATRQRLKQALAELLRTHTFHEIRLEDITGQAGVRVSLFYHYFQSKIDITQEVLSDMLDAFRAEVTERPRDANPGTDPMAAIHYANQRMVALYSANPGAMRCLLAVDEAVAPFAAMWRELTLGWNQRIAARIRRYFPDAFGTDDEYLSLAYALAGTADSFLFEYFVLNNPVLRRAHPAEEDVAAFLTTLWYRALYLANPPDQILGRQAGFRTMGLAHLAPPKAP